MSSTVRATVHKMQFHAYAVLVLESAVGSDSGGLAPPANLSLTCDGGV